MQWPSTFTAVLQAAHNKPLMATASVPDASSVRPAETGAISLATPAQFVSELRGIAQRTDSLSIKPEPVVRRHCLRTQPVHTFGVVARERFQPFQFFRVLPPSRSLKRPLLRQTKQSVPKRKTRTNESGPETGRLVSQSAQPFSATIVCNSAALQQLKKLQSRWHHRRPLRRPRSTMPIRSLTWKRRARPTSACCSRPSRRPSSSHRIGHAASPRLALPPGSPSNSAPLELILEIVFSFLFSCCVPPTQKEFLTHFLCSPPVPLKLRLCQECNIYYLSLVCHFWFTSRFQCY